MNFDLWNRLHHFCMYSCQFNFGLLCGFHIALKLFDKDSSIFLFHFYVLAGTKIIREVTLALCRFCLSGLLFFISFRLYVANFFSPSFDIVGVYCEKDSLIV
jgi:hypothetical protein